MIKPKIELAWASHLTLMATDIKRFSRVLAEVSEWRHEAEIPAGFTIPVAYDIDGETEQAEITFEEVVGWAVTLRISREGTKDLRLEGLGVVCLPNGMTYFRWMIHDLGPADA